jgi:hypothetical protein
MKRTLIVPALAALAFAGCTVSNHGSVQITQMCATPTPTAEGCSFTPGECEEINADGFLEVDLALNGNTLLYPLQIDNQRADPSDTDIGRTANANDAYVERLDMRYEGSGVRLSASSPQSATVPAGGSTALVAVLIPSTAGAELASQLPTTETTVIIHVKAHGRYGDDTQFDTAEYVVPVHVTNGTTAPLVCSDRTKTLVCCPVGATAGGQTGNCACL